MTLHGSEEAVELPHVHSLQKTQKRTCKDALLQAVGLEIVSPQCFWRL